MTGECPNCRPGATCAACLDFAHTAHITSGFDRAPGCARCKPLPRNRFERRGIKCWRCDDTKRIATRQHFPATKYQPAGTLLSDAPCPRCSSPAAPAHNPGARVVPTGGGR